MISSGMGAIATTLLTLLRAGEGVVSARQVHGDTRDLLVRDLPIWGFDVAQVDATDLAALSTHKRRFAVTELRASPGAGLGGRARPDLPAPFTVRYRP